MISCELCCCADRWVGTHFGWPCVAVRGSDQVHFGFGGSQSKQPDMDIEKLAFMSRAQRPALWDYPARQETFLVGLGLLPGA